MNQKIIAKKHGIPDPVLSRVLNGRIKVANMTATRAIALTQVFDLDIDTLIAASPSELKLRFTVLHEIGGMDGQK